MQKMHLKVLLKLSTHGIGSGAWPSKLIRNLLRVTQLGSWVSRRQHVPRRGLGVFFSRKNRRFANPTLSRSRQNVPLSHLRSWNMGNYRNKNTKHRIQQKQNTKKRKDWNKQISRSSAIQRSLIKLIFTQSQWISKSWWSKRLTVTQASQGPQKMALPSLRLASSVRCEGKVYRFLTIPVCCTYVIK